MSLPDDDPVYTLKKSDGGIRFFWLVFITILRVSWILSTSFWKYNAFLQENDYGVKYGLGNAQMFVIEGMDKVRELKERSHANIQREQGILKRQTRSIQTEGHFGDIKENENFRRFNYRSSDKVYKEFMLYAIGRNINKYHRFLYEKLKKKF